MIALEKLRRVGEAGSAQLNDLTADCYEELRRLAAVYLRHERSDHTLQATALVHEAFLDLVRRRNVSWEHRAQLIGIAAHSMRRILVSYGRARARLKRGGPGAVRLPLDEALDFSEGQGLDLAAVDEALTQLEAVDARQATIVEMRFFGGMNVAEIAAELGLSPATVKRDWSTAKLWLREQLGG